MSQYHFTFRWGGVCWEGVEMWVQGKIEMMSNPYTLWINKESFQKKSKAAQNSKTNILTFRSHHTHASFPDQHFINDCQIWYAEWKNYAGSNFNLQISVGIEVLCNFLTRLTSAAFSETAAYASHGLTQ